MLRTGKTCFTLGPCDRMEGPNALAEYVSERIQ